MRMMTTGLSALALFLSACACDAADRLAQCYLRVDGKVYLDRPCHFAAERDGSFTIGTAGESGSARSPYFAYVNTNPDGTAQGYWNEDPASTHAHANLGILKRKGACWENAQAKVCAR